MRTDLKVIRSIVPLLGRYRWALPLVVALGVLASLAEGIGISLFAPFLQNIDANTGDVHTGNRFLDSMVRLFSSVPPEKRFGMIALAIFACILAKAAIGFANTCLFRWVESQVGHRLRTDIFEQLLNVSFRFLETDKLGRLMNVLTTETWRVGEAIANFIGLLTTACTTVVYLGLLLMISWKLTLVVAGVMLIISLLVHQVRKRGNTTGAKVTETNAILANRMVEGMEGMKVIRAFGQEQYERFQFQCASEQVRRALYKLQLLGAAVHPIYEVLVALLLILILSMSGQSPTDRPAIIVFIFILYRLQPRLMALEAARVSLASLEPAIKEVTALLEKSDKVYLSSGSIAPEMFKDEIRFDNVVFHYDKNDAPALDNISFRIPAGKTTALVGPSGAGKTTLIHLLLRFYDPDRGDIHVDGQRLRDFDATLWRRQIAVVSQDVYLFNTTIRRNIAYGLPDASHSEIIAAAKKAHAHEFIELLPKGYDTEVGDRGVRLSGGQKQRITMARAIIRNPEILILDEATNSLDTISEQIIQDALNIFSKDRTVIVIAHRLSTIARADQIAVLEKGRIRECGGLESLLRANGLFARLYKTRENVLT